MLCFNDGIFFSDNIIQCFLLWMKYQSVKIKFLNTQCFHDDDNIKIIQKMKMMNDNFSNYKFIFIPHQYGVHWWINIFVKLKNDSYSLNELHTLVILDSMIGKNTNSILKIKNKLQYFVYMKHIEVQHVKLKNI